MEVILSLKNYAFHVFNGISCIQRHSFQSRLLICNGHTTSEAFFLITPLQEATPCILLLDLTLIHGSIATKWTLSEKISVWLQQLFLHLSKELLSCFTGAEPGKMKYSIDMLSNYILSLVTSLNYHGYISHVISTYFAGFLIHAPAE